MTSRPGADRRGMAGLRRAALVPVGAASVITVAAVAGALVAPGSGPGSVLAWLLLGLTAGYALSGSV